MFFLVGVRGLQSMSKQVQTTCNNKVLFTDDYTWQNFGLRFLGLVNSFCFLFLTEEA